MASIRVPGTQTLSLPAQPVPASPFMGGGGGRAPIAGNLPFDRMATANFLPTDLASLGRHATETYSNALAMQSSNYSNIIAGYGQTMAQQTSAQDAIAGGYTNLYNDVLGQLGNQGDAQRSMINRDYAANVGRSSQQLIDRGLGNSTVQSSVNRGFEFDRALAGNALNEQVGRQYADYASRLGQAGLDYRDRANMQNTGQSNRQLDWMNSVNSPYPDAGMYSQLAMQYGQADEARRNREAFAAGGGPAWGGGAGGTRSGTYGNHFQKGFSGGEGGGYVQLGGGGGGGGYVSPPMGYNDYGGQQPPMLDYSPGSYSDIYTNDGAASYFDQATAGAVDQMNTPSYFDQAYNSVVDPYSYENYGQFVSPAEPTGYGGDF